MKTLHLLRHAKSAWDQPNLSDRDRGLNKRGKRDAPRMGEALAQRMAPMHIHVSPARRAQLTLKGLSRGWPELGSIDHTTAEDLYTFASEDLRLWIMQQDDRQGGLFIISHNPALTDLVNTLVGQHCMNNLPTAGYVELALPIEHWRDLSRFGAVLECSLRPSELNRR